MAIKFFDVIKAKSVDLIRPSVQFESILVPEYRVFSICFKITSTVHWKKGLDAFFLKVAVARLEDHGFP